MPRVLVLTLAGLCMFTVVAAIMAQIMPGPLKEFDYLVIGSVSTLVALLVLFLVLISTTMKSSNVFFKKRRK